MPNGAVVDANGNVVGYVDENGNVVTDEIIGKTGPKRRLAYDKDGNVIGYIDENGRLELEKADLLAYSHGQYRGLGKNLGSFGFSVRKKKKKHKKK